MMDIWRSACLAALGLALASPGPASPVKALSRPRGPVMSAKADLDGDGKPEAIKLLVGKNDRSKYVLYIGGKQVSGQLGYDIAGFEIVDIDKRDAHREVAVYTPGPSDDDEFALYWYAGTTITYMGTLARWPHFLGNGDVVVGGWNDFWQSYDLYRLDPKTKALKLIPQQYLYMGATSRVSAPLTLYQTQDKRKVLVVVPAGEKVTLLATDRKWVLVKTAHDLLGWIPYLEGGVYSNLPELNYAD